MKKVLLTTMVLGFLVTNCFAGINEQLMQNSAINLLEQSKKIATTTSEDLVLLRQSIEDQLASKLTTLDSTDKSNLNVLAAELQKIIDAANSLVNKIETHYPEVK